MNKERRNRLSEISDLVGDAIDQLEEIMEEEQEALDNLPESLQSSSKGEAMDEAITSMQDIMDELTTIQTDIDELV